MMEAYNMDHKDHCLYSYGFDPARHNEPKTLTDEYGAEVTYYPDLESEYFTTEPITPNNPVG